MRAFTAARDALTPDELWLCEHPPVFTQGIAGRAEHLLDPGGIPVAASDRGGQVTYHGPGQVVAYPLVDLRRLGIYVKEYVFRLEQALLKTLESHGVTGHRVRGEPGIYVRPDDPFGHAAHACRRPGGEVRRPGQDRLDRRESEQALQLSRRGPQRRHGPAPLRTDQPLRSCRAGRDRPFYNRRARLVGRGGDDPRRQARRLPGPPMTPTPTYDPTVKQKAEAKTSRIPIKVVAAETLKKPDWIRVKAGSPTTRFYEIKQILREHKLHTVCEEASCPNIGECFGKGTATFMIMGDKCTRRCPFCDVGHGRPDPLDADEPLNLAKTIAALKLKYVVITSVDRDDLRDGGAAHFVACIEKTRELSPGTQIEILTPDFRGRMDRALEILKARRRT